MFMQAKELKKFSKQGKLEMFTWISTFLCVVIIDIDIGWVESQLHYTELI